jgi:alanine racemase
VKNWIEISESRLTANYNTLADVAGPISVLAVIKADAYGHSAAQCAPVLARAGAPWLGVTDVREAVQVQAELIAAGIAPADQPRILIMSGSLPDESPLIVDHAVTPVVWSIEELEALRTSADAGNTKLAVHVEIDTGMSRQGCAAGDELQAILNWFAAQSTLSLDGIMTHFASAEIAGSPVSTAQQQAFELAIAQIKASGLEPQWVHAGNSSAVDNLHPFATNTPSPAINLSFRAKRSEAEEPPHSAHSATDTSPAAATEQPTSLQWLAQQAAALNAKAMVRTGLALYGRCLPVEPALNYTGPHEASVCPSLLPVLTWKARVIGLREIAPGTHVGYGATFTAPHPMRLALLPVGYADGLRRELSSSPTGAGWVMLHGQRASIVGRISMNLTVVDVTAIQGVAVGDEAIVLGEGSTAEDHARIAGTIPYEILCGMQAHSFLS